MYICEYLNVMVECVVSFGSSLYIYIHLRKKEEEEEEEIYLYEYDAIQ